MKKGLEITCAAGLVMLFGGLAWAMNSLVGPDGLNKMKQAKISNEVIEMLVAEQTCSVTGESLVRLKKAGADDETLKSVILADRYKNPVESSHFISPVKCAILGAVCVYKLNSLFKCLATAVASAFVK